MVENFRTISLPEEIIQRIEKKIKGSKYQSVSQYIEEVLRETLNAEEMDIEPSRQKERKRIKKRLKELGYLD